VNAPLVLCKVVFSTSHSLFLILVDLVFAYAGSVVGNIKVFKHLSCPVLSLSECFALLTVKHLISAAREEWNTSPKSKGQEIITSKHGNKKPYIYSVYSAL